VNDAFDIFDVFDIFDAFEQSAAPPRIESCPNRALVADAWPDLELWASNCLQSVIDPLLAKLYGAL
jgi:hypothetical protein